eukprot:9477619-Pyramimonas_sp.AAC.1
MQAEMISNDSSMSGRTTGAAIARKAPPNRRGGPSAPNPACPLLFEVAGAKLDMEYPEADVSMYRYVGAESVAIEAFYRDAAAISNQFDSSAQLEALLFANDAAKEAALKALQGFGKENGADIAKEALQICKACPDAYNLLALSAAESFEQALEYYQQGESCAADSLATDDFHALVSRLPAWKYVTLHPYFRSVHGCANTLRKMGRYEESLAKYRCVHVASVTIILSPPPIILKAAVIECYWA